MAISEENLRIAWAYAFPSEGTGTLTVLDYYAAAALTGIVAKAGVVTPQEAANQAWQLAEAMVEGRPQRPRGPVVSV